jgi:hypothetical protein
MNFLIVDYRNLLIISHVERFDLCGIRRWGLTAFDDSCFPSLRHCYLNMLNISDL